MMDINEFLIQATLSYLRAGGGSGTQASFAAVTAAKSLLIQTYQPFNDNTNLTNFKKIHNIA